MVEHFLMESLRTANQSLRHPTQSILKESQCHQESTKTENPSDLEKHQAASRSLPEDTTQLDPMASQASLDMPRTTSLSVHPLTILSMKLESLFLLELIPLANHFLQAKDLMEKILLLEHTILLVLTAELLPKDALRTVTLFHPLRNALLDPPDNHSLPESTKTERLFLPEKHPTERISLLVRSTQLDRTERQPLEDSLQTTSLSSPLPSSP
jgi:hypothetical protein